MISSELEELLEGSDRVVVLRDGQTVASLEREDISLSAVVEAMVHGDDDISPETAKKEEEASHGEA